MVICTRAGSEFNDIIEYQRRVDHANRSAIAGIADGAGSGNGMGMRLGAGIDAGGAGAMRIAVGTPVKAVVVIGTCTGAIAGVATCATAEVFGKVGIQVSMIVAIAAGGYRSAGKAMVVAGQVVGAECHRLAAAGSTQGIVSAQATSRGEAVGGCATHIVETKDRTATQVRQVEGGAAITAAIGGANGGKQGGMGTAADRIATAQDPAIGSRSAGKGHDGTAGYTAGATSGQVGPGTAGIIIKTAGTIGLVYEQTRSRTADAGALRFGKAGHERPFIGTGHIELGAGMGTIGTNAYLGLCSHNYKKKKSDKKIFHIGGFKT